MISHDTQTNNGKKECIQKYELESLKPVTCRVGLSGISFNFGSLSVSSWKIQHIVIKNRFILYSVATINNIDYYDIYYQAKSIGQEFAKTQTACISSFTSGGKNDKDACRDVMKTKCGKEIDFRCKQSSLYDILNEMPISSYQLPPACLDYANNSQSANTVCLNWINEKFMLGGIIPKPSQFISYSLTDQADSNYYKEQQEEYKAKYDGYSIVSSSPYLFQVLN